MKPVVVVKIIGGLGNQMFQYATAFAVARRMDAHLFLDISQFNTYDLHNFSMSAYRLRGQILRSRLGLYSLYIKKGFCTRFRIINEKNLKFDSDLFNLKSSLVLNGYFQSEKYFQTFRDEIVNSFKIQDEQLSPYSFEILKQLRSCTDYVSLHIRRGDYLKSENLAIHGICSLDYYRSAIHFFCKRNKNSKFVIFSDDIQWAKDNLELDETNLFIDGNGADRNYEDIVLMSNCRNNIIANSSFSWWGAWLNTSPEKIVIAPEKWFASEELFSNDIYPKDWVKM